MNTPDRSINFCFVRSLTKALLLAATGVFLLTVVDEAGFAFLGWDNQDNLMRWVRLIGVMPILLAFLLSPIYLAIIPLFLYLVSREKSSRTALWMGTGLGIFLSCITGLDAGFHHWVESYIEPMKLSVFGLKNKNCVNALTGFGDGNRLGICESKFYNNWFGLGDPPYELVIVYDSSDQLLLPPDKRSHEWQETAAQIGLRREDIAEKSKPVDAFGNIIPLGRHFYRVTM